MLLSVLALPPSFTEVQHLVSPIQALLHPAADSATSNLLMLAPSQSAICSVPIWPPSSPTLIILIFRRAVPALPARVGILVRSAMLLSLVGAVLPSFTPEANWQGNALIVLDEMVPARSVVAPLRTSELQDLEELLAPIRRQLIVPAEPSGHHVLRGTMAATPPSQLARGGSWGSRGSCLHRRELNGRRIVQRR